MNKDKKLNDSKINEVNGGYILNYDSYGLYLIVDNDGHVVDTKANPEVNRDLKKAEEFAKNNGYKTMEITSDECEALKNKGVFERNGDYYYASWLKPSENN